MAKLNINKGDIPETDQEVEKIVEKMEKKAARKTAKKVVSSVAENHQPGQPLPEDATERAASGSGWQGEEVVDKPVRKSTKVRQLVALQNPSTEVSLEKAEEMALVKHIQEAKAALKKSRGHTIDGDCATEIASEHGLDATGKKVEAVVLDGNGQVVTDKKTKNALLRAEQKAAKPKVVNIKAKDQPEVTEALVKQVLTLRDQGKTTIETMPITGLSYNTIRSILTGKSYSQWSGITWIPDPKYDKLRKHPVNNTQKGGKK